MRLRDAAKERNGETALSGESLKASESKVNGPGGGDFTLSPGQDNLLERSNELMQ